MADDGTTNPNQLHGTAIVIDGRGVLIRGASGSGKSDLALRLIDGGGFLVADDRVDATVADGELVMSPPAAIAGLLEIRGIGIVELGATPDVKLRLVVDLVAADLIERHPEPRTVSLSGIEVPSLMLDPFEGSAAAKIRAALKLATGQIGRRL